MKKVFTFLFLVGCSFNPVFSGGDTDVYVAPISGINGIEVRNFLNAKFGGSHENGAKYNLTVQLDNPTTKYKALARTGGATWQEVKLTASYVLKQGDVIIAKGKESASESYTFVGYLVAANASYNNAVTNTIRELSDKISIQVISQTQKHQN